MRQAPSVARDARRAGRRLSTIAAPSLCVIVPGQRQGRGGARRARCPGLAVTAAQRKQVLACTDATLLDSWLRAAVATSSVKVRLAESTPRRARERRG